MLNMRKFLNILKYKLSWQTYKDAFFWMFVCGWVFIDVVTMACIHDNPNIDSEFVMHIINFVFVMIFGVITYIKCSGGKFNDWLNTKFDKYEDR